MRARQENINL